jgi:N-acetylglucosaminyl-diphospho-decaprenol L-rhamnosyltransferase
MTSRHDTAVVIAAHSHDYTLAPCLSSVIPLLHRPEDLIFVDNGSGQNLCTRISAQFPGITAVTLDRNFLFCGGYNAGIRVAMARGYEFILILNADTEVINPEFLSELLKAADRWPEAAFIGPLVYWRSENVVQKTCLQFPRICRNVLVWLPWRIARKYFENQPNIEFEVEFLNGVCVLCRRTALEEVGLLDENFGGYVEDADWSWRACKRGWKSIFTPVPSIIHHESSLGYEPYSLKTFLLKRNTVLWYLKIGCRISALSYAAAAVCLAFFRMMSATSKDERKKHRNFINSLCRAYLGLLRGETPGGWFGPPLEAWSGNVIASD